MIADIHQDLCPGKDLIDARRALFKMAARVLANEGRTTRADFESSAVLDDPVFRLFVTELLRGREPDFCLEEQRELLHTNTQPLAAVQPGEHTLLVIAGHVGIVCTYAATYFGLTDVSEPFLPVADPGYAPALAALQEGVNYALSTVPALASDVFMHVAGCLLLSSPAASSVRSGAVRDLGGMIAVHPTGKVETAEMLLHEACHATLFDLMQVGDFIREEDAAASQFAPPWHEPSASWPLEQTLAAFHAYAALTEFHDEVVARQEASDLSSHSLLPAARERRDIIGEWLMKRRDCLGHDAVFLVQRALGVDVRLLPPAVVGHEWIEERVSSGEYCVDHTASRLHALIGRSSPPYDFHIIERRAREAYLA